MGFIAVELCLIENVEIKYNGYNSYQDELD